MRSRHTLTYILLICLCLSSPLAAADLDFSKSVTIGSGPKVVVEFTDPDCPFCRRAAAYFESRSDLTRHIYFFPLPRHPRAREKARYILSQFDRSRAYHQVMSGTLDKSAPLTTTPAGTRLQGEQLEIARKMKITSTPTFIISGRVIEGFDQKRIEEALGD